MTKFIKYEDILLLPTVGKTTENGELIEEYIPKSQLETIPESEVIPISFIKKWIELHEEHISIRPINFMLKDYIQFEKGEQE